MSLEDPEIKPVLEHVESLGQSGRFSDARAALASALGALGDRAALLAKAAEIEFQQENFELALSYSERAVAASPTDPKILADHASLLEDMGLTREAVKFLANLPESVSQDSKVREALADLYSDCGWHALAVDVVGHRKKLQSSSARKAWRHDWWRSGGPVKLLRKLVRAVNDKQRSTWEHFTQNLTILDSFDRPHGFARIWRRSILDHYLLEMARLSIWWEYLGRWAPRAFRVVVVILGYLAVWITAASLHPHAGLVDGAIPALVSTAIAVIVWRVMARIVNSFNGFRNQLLVGAALTALIVVPGILAIRSAHSLAAAYEIIGLGLVAAPCIGACATACTVALYFIQLTQFKALRRSYPGEAALDVILDVINEMSLSENRSDLTIRRKWMQWLEFGARHIEIDLPRALGVNNVETDRWIHERAKGAAAGLRRIIRQIAVSGPNTLDRVLLALRAEATALACGDLASLSYAKPPPKEAPGKRWRRITVTVTRTILVMAAPIAAVLVLQVFSAFTPNGLTWAKVISLGWALLYLLITIDPTLNDKITAARNLIETVRETRPPRSTRSVDDSR